MYSLPNENKIVVSHPKYLWFLTLSYTMVIVFANWFDPRLIKFFGLDTFAGTLIFPITFLLSDLITEIYGYKLARRAIWCGLLFNIIFIGFSQVMMHLPSPDFPENNALFDNLHATRIRLIIASIISYFCAEPLNSIIMAKLKIKMQGRNLSLRFGLSTFLASGVDSLIFAAIAFYGTISNPNLIRMMLIMWWVKVAVSLIGLPIAVRLAEKLKTVELLDIYDKRTKFYMFCLDTSYEQNDNEYLKIKN
jgi:queuosine precursor transporter